jgi:hypothetical protein
MKISPSIILKLVGLLCVLLAMFGLWYSISSYLRIHSGHFSPVSDAPYFTSAFTIMLSITATLLVLMLWNGIQLILQKVTSLQLFVATCLLIIAFIFASGSLWLDPVLGRSIATATGVASGGLSLFYLLLFPLWAPFAVSWAFRRMKVAEQGAAANP